MFELKDVQPKVYIYIYRCVCVCIRDVYTRVCVYILCLKER